jgi:hypothetical protein
MEFHFDREMTIVFLNHRLFESFHWILSNWPNLHKWSNWDSYFVKLFVILTWRPYFALETNKRFIDGIISLAYAPVHVTDFPVLNVPVDELSSARIGQQKLCATMSENVNINYCLPIKAYYRICTLWHIRIEINHGSHTNIRQPMLNLKTHSGFHDLFLNYLRYSCLSPVNNFSAIWWLPYLLWEENQDRHYEITYETSIG